MITPTRCDHIPFLVYKRVEQSLIGCYEFMMWVTTNNDLLKSIEVRWVLKENLKLSSAKYNGLLNGSASIIQIRENTWTFYDRIWGEVKEWLG